MKIVEVRDVEDCFDGSFVKEVLFNDIITSDFINYLCKEGEFQYHKSFARPFFKIDNPGKYIVMGVEGNKTVKIVLYRKNIDESLKYFLNYIKKFK